LYSPYTPHDPQPPFFFPSRRRHTTFSRDWSSDVCSSDLPAGRPTVVQGKVIDPRGLQMPASRQDLHVPDQVKKGLSLTFFDVPRVNQLQVAVDNTTHRVVPRLLRAVRLS